VSSFGNASAAIRGLSFPVKATAWILGAIVFAIVGLSLEQDPVKQSTARLKAYESQHHIQSAQQGGGSAGGKGAPETSGAAPVGVPGTEGKDKQLSAGSVPSELTGERIPKGITATDAGVRKLFAATLGSRGRAGQTTNTLKSVSCRAETCKISYVPDGPGVGRVIETQGSMWAGLLSDRKWRSATIVALPVTRGHGKQVGATTTIACTRAGVLKVGKWGIQSTPKIRRFCRVT
jgi:hypothetical protein